MHTQTGSTAELASLARPGWLGWLGWLGRLQGPNTRPCTQSTGNQVSNNKHKQQNHKSQNKERAYLQTNEKPKTKNKHKSSTWERIPRACWHTLEWHTAQMRGSRLSHSTHSRSREGCSWNSRYSPDTRPQRCSGWRVSSLAWSHSRSRAVQFQNRCQALENDTRSTDRHEM